MQFLSNAIAALAGIVLFCLATLGFAIYYAWVLEKLWGWFVVDGLHLQPIGLAVAYGITLIISYLIVSPLRIQIAVDEEGAVRRISQWLLTPIVTLFVGWIAHHWV